MRGGEKDRSRLPASSAESADSKAESAFGRDVGASEPSQPRGSIASSTADFDAAAFAGGTWCVYIEIRARAEHGGDAD